MKLFTQLCFCVLAWGVCENIGRSAIPDHALLESPSKEYSVRVSEIGGNGGSAAHALDISYHGMIVAHYPFEGELVSAYWSPSGRYVAINNHSGHYGWWLWIVDLRDGHIIRAENVVASSDYDRYSDYQCFPDLFDSAEARNKIGAIYGAYSSDQMRLGYTTVGYGWRKGDLLLVYHRLAFDRLAAGSGAIIQVLEKFKVSARGITILEGSVSAKRVKLSDEEKEMPTEVKPLFD